jgi:hypothetical protein
MPSNDQILISVGRLQLVFRRQGDRYGHDLGPSVGGAPTTAEFRPLLRSVEGAPDDLWPPSPPLQECHIEPRPDGRTAALLVGRAGKSHWSLSVLCDPASSSLLFEAACRLQGDAHWLGSRYRMAEPDIYPVEAGSTAAANLPLTLGVQAASGQWDESLLEAMNSPFDRPSREISIAARGHTIGGGARTLQWSYRIRPTD